VNTDRTLQDIGRCSAECIAEMVAALECDYERLAELRDLRSEYRENATTGGDDCGFGDDEAEELAELEKAAGDCESREDAEQRIHEDPLSLELSGTWTPGNTPVADKAILLLGTGGPAVRLIVELGEYAEPHRAYLQVQNWGTPWTDVFTDSETLLRYAQCFYYGEG
jgi:hypothetical protein